MDAGTTLSKRDRVRRSMLSLLPKNSTGAEIGVSEGKFSAVMIEVVAPRELVLIDPWDLLAQQADASNKDSRWFLKEDLMASYHQRVIDRFADEDCVTVCRGFSMDVLATYAESYFDWVYIDASHTYDEVCADLEMSIRKVKPGGLITGDDFFAGKGDRKEVKQAVLDTLEKSGAPTDMNVFQHDDLPETITHPSRIGQQYMIPVTAEMKASLGV